MGRKRRGSQAFSFEQTEETLLQNESIVKLYQNKTFEPPDPAQLETIREEGGGGLAKRVKRGETEDGFLVLGVNKARRVIEDYKFWKQDDKEKIRKRKLKIAKQWKGRKRLRMKPLNPELETKLIDLIADRVPSDDEDPDYDDPDHLSSQCVWEASSPLVSSRGFSEHSEDLDHFPDDRPQCVWEASSSLLNSRDFTTSQGEVESLQHSEGFDHSQDCRPQGVSPLETRSSPTLKPLSNIANLSHGNQPSEEVTNENDVLTELQGLVPESELEELLQCEDFLFCGSQDMKSEVSPPVQVSGSSRRSVRRSARIMSVPNITGSIFTGVQDQPDHQENIQPRPKKVKKVKNPQERSEEADSPLKVKKKRTRKCTPQGPESSLGQVLKDVTNRQEEPASNDKKKRKEENSELAGHGRTAEGGQSEDKLPAVKVKRRKSYSLEEGGARYSLDGSRMNRSVRPC